MADLMNRSTTAREALVAELIGDVAPLVDRVELLTPTMDKAREAMLEAAWTLDSRLEAFKHEMAAAMEQSKAIAIKDIKLSTYQFAMISIQKQKEAMTDATRGAG